MSDVESVERVIAAPPELIFGIVADPGRHHEFDGSGTVRDATDQPARLELGSTFGMSMHLGFGYSTVNTIVEYDENRRISWQTTPTMGPLTKLIGGRIWRYELEPVDGGTLVRESWDISQERIKLLVEPARKKTKQSMDATLARLEAVVAADAG